VARAPVSEPHDAKSREEVHPPGTTDHLALTRQSRLHVTTPHPPITAHMGAHIAGYALPPAEGSPINWRRSLARILIENAGVEAHNGLMEYRQTQWGGFGLPVLVMFLLMFAFAVVLDFESSKLFDVAVLAIMVAAIILGVMFSRLTVTVTRDRIVASFLFGRPRRVIELPDVVAMRYVRNLRWHGLGVRRIPGGWMYNVWALDAVELELISGEVFRLGSTDPEGLFDALSSRVTT
jgi:hypothetical protein